MTASLQGLRLDPTGQAGGMGLSDAPGHAVALRGLRRRGQPASPRQPLLVPVARRLQASAIEELRRWQPRGGGTALGRRHNPPGVVGYDDDGVPVGWCSIGPRSENARLASSRLIRPLDDLDVWSVICVVVRSGHRKRGFTTPLIEGAVAWAASRGAPAVEAYPVDPRKGRST